MLQALQNLLFPQRNTCHVCDACLGESGLLCATCIDRMAMCRLSDEEQAVQELPEAVNAAASAFRHEHEARELVISLKFRHDRMAALPLAKEMASVFLQEAELRRCELCVPVASHAARKRERGYNQAEVLCKAFAEIVGMPMEPNALRRVQAHRSQIASGAEARRTNVRGAFAVADVSAVQGRRLLLVDDVLTTGATLEECARTLLEAGAASVAALTACRA